MTVTPKLDSRASALRPKDSGAPEVTAPAAKAAPANSFTQAAVSRPVSLLSPAARNVVLPSMTPGSAKAEALTVVPVRPELNEFLQSTRDLRSTLETLRTLPPSDPKYAAAAQ